jgi:DNA-binding CsgD family transcriptional regulator
MSRSEPNSTEAPVEPLTRREREILALLAQGLSGPEIAQKLTLARSSVKWHLRQVYGKLGVNSKQRALRRAQELGLLAAAGATADPKPADAHPSAPAPRHNLPLQLTHFIGRTQQIAEVKRLLRGNRLLTLIGPGGTGKTRLALQVAAEMLDEFPDGAWLVELAPIAEPAGARKSLVRPLRLCRSLTHLGNRSRSVFVVTFLRRCLTILRSERVQPRDFIMRHHLIRLPVVTLVLAALACGMLGSPAATPAVPSPAASPSSQPASPTPAAPAFNSVIAMLGPKGEVSPEMALQAFALAIAPLPGVTPPAGALGNLDADAAVAWVSQVWDQLSPAQQTTITDALALMPDPYGSARTPAASAPSLTLAAWPPAVGAAVPDCGLFLVGPAADPGDVPAAPSPAVQPYVDMVKAAHDAIADPSHLGRQSVSKLAVCLVPGESLSANALARPYDAEHKQLGLPVSCAIYLNEDTIEGIAQAGQLGFLMAAETFACFAVTAKPDETIAAFGARVVPPWVSGGASTWAAATVAIELFGGVGDVLSEPWSGYLTEPERNLVQRHHSAIGFFAQVNQDKPTAWNVLDEMLTSVDNLGAFYAATGRRQSFIDLWAAGYFRDASRGPDWDIIGPNIPDDTAEAGSIEVGNGESQDMAAPVLAVAIADLSTSADVTILAGNHLRIHDGVQDFTDVRNQAYCTRGGSSDCTCPPGSRGAARPPLPSLNADVKLALTGMEIGGTATIQGLSLDDYCGLPPTAEPASGVWSMVFWSPDRGTSYSPFMMAYTCDGLVSTWKANFMAFTPLWEWPFDLPFADGLVVHRDFHKDIPPDQQTVAKDLDYSLDFTLDPNTNPPVITVSGTKILSNDGGGGSQPYSGPHEFGSDAPLELKNVSLETQMKPYPQYQHPFRAQALAECGQ